MQKIKPREALVKIDKRLRFHRGSIIADGGFAEHAEPINQHRTRCRELITRIMEEAGVSVEKMAVRNRRDYAADWAVREVESTVRRKRLVLAQLHERLLAIILCNRPPHAPSHAQKGKHWSVQK